jgi:hypothetical protein
MGRKSVEDSRQFWQHHVFLVFGEDFAADVREGASAARPDVA